MSFLARSPRLIALFLAAFSALFVSAKVSVAVAAPIEVTHSFSIEHGNWTPLSVREMERASIDAGLARLSDAGRLRILESAAATGEVASRGRLSTAIHLIGPAETAKVTMTLDSPGSPTLVATAAISVRGLDHRGIFRAFEHVGEEAADRLVAKLDHLASTPIPETGPAPSGAPDPKRKRAYDTAQAAKRAGRYAEARVGFESVAASSSDPRDGLRRLAEDELRYGLPVYEAQQALNLLGRLGHPNKQTQRTASLSRAENLYRQVEAENQDNYQRIAEAQRAIDTMLVMRRAMDNAMRANLMSRAMSLRMEIMEFAMMEGECPKDSFVNEVVSRRAKGLALREVVPTGPGETRYRIEEEGSGLAIDLLCGPEGVEAVAVEEGDGEASPAAH